MAQERNPVPDQRGGINVNRIIEELTEYEEPKVEPSVEKEKEKVEIKQVE